MICTLRMLERPMDWRYRQHGFGSDLARNECVFGCMSLILRRRLKVKGKNQKASSAMHALAKM